VLKLDWKRLSLEEAHVWGMCSLTSWSLGDLLSNIFVSPKFWLAKGLIFRAVGGMRRVQISCDICTRFARYLYSTKQCWIISQVTGHITVTLQLGCITRLSLFIIKTIIFSEASQRSGILNPWIWLANSARSSGPDSPIRTPPTDRSEFSNIHGYFSSFLYTKNLHEM